MTRDLIENIHDIICTLLGLFFRQSESLKACHKAIPVYRRADIVFLHFIQICREVTINGKYRFGHIVDILIHTAHKDREYPVCHRQFRPQSIEFFDRGYRVDPRHKSVDQDRILRFHRSSVLIEIIDLMIQIMDQLLVTARRICLIRCCDLINQIVQLIVHLFIQRIKSTRDGFSV